MTFFRISGFLALFFGTLAALFSMNAYFLILALPSAFLGYIFSVAYIFIKTRKEIKTAKINQGIVGMILSSVPIAIVLYVNFFR